MVDIEADHVGVEVDVRPVRDFRVSAPGPALNST